LDKELNYEEYFKVFIINPGFSNALVLILAASISPIAYQRIKNERTV
jgi:hypothetical protein